MEDKVYEDRNRKQEKIEKAALKYVVRKLKFVNKVKGNNRNQSRLRRKVDK